MGLNRNGRRLIGTGRGSKSDSTVGALVSSRRQSLAESKERTNNALEQETRLEEY